MKILLMTTHLNPGGVTEHVLSLQEGLRRLGHDVWVAADLLWRRSGMGPPIFEASSENRIRSFRWGTKSELSIRLWSQGLHLFHWMRAQRFDLIHAHTRVTQVLACAVGRWLGCPIVTTCHGYFRPRWSRLIWPSWGNAVIAVSHPVALHLKQDFKWPAARIHVVHHGLDLKTWSLRTSEERLRQRRSWGVAPEEWVLGNVARLSSVKGWDVLIRTAQWLRQQGKKVRLIIGSSGPQEAEIKALLNKADLSQAIIQPCLQDRSRDLLVGMDVLVAPSHQEGFGLAVLEAQAVGVPVVVSDVGGHRDLVVHEETGLKVASFDPLDYAQAVCRFMEDRPLRDRITDAARASVETHFTKNKMIQGTVAVYQSVLAQKNKQ